MKRKKQLVITNSASKQLDTKDAQINFLKDKLKKWGKKTNGTITR